MIMVLSSSGLRRNCWIVCRPSFSGHHNVEQNQVGIKHFCLSYGFIAVVSSSGFVSCLFQIVIDEFNNILFIINHENFPQNWIPYYGFEFECNIE